MKATRGSEQYYPVNSSMTCPYDSCEIAAASEHRLLDGFEGKLTTTKWAKLTKSSQDSAHRDITDLVERGILVRSKEGGRSTSYALASRRAESP